MCYKYNQNPYLSLAPYYIIIKDYLTYVKLRVNNMNIVFSFGVSINKRLKTMKSLIKVWSYILDPIF